MTGTAAAGTLLAVFAHPDDETYLAGPLLAHLAARGVAVHLVCATPEPGAAGSSAAVRRAELAEAAGILGIRAVHHLGLSETELWQASVGELAERAAPVARALAPNAILTDSAYGAYGHAHHILLHRVAIATGSLLAQEGLPIPVYALAYPLPLVKAYFGVAGAFGLLTQLEGGRRDINLRAIVAAQRPPDLVLNVAAAVAKRKQAGASHRSQLAGAPLPLRLLEASPVWVQARLFGTARLNRVAAGTGDPAWLR